MAPISHALWQTTRRRHALSALGGAADPVQSLIDMYEGGTYGGALYDPSNAATMFQDRSATPSTAAGNGDVVGTMTDLGPNGIEAIAPADANRATLTQSGDLWYLACSGTTLTHYYKSTWGETISQPFTVCIAVYPELDNDYYACGGPLTTQRHALLGVGAEPTGVNRMYAGANIDHGTVLHARNAPIVILAIFNGASSVFRINGAETTGDAGTQTHSESTWGARFDGAQPLQGRLYFIMKIHRILTASEIAAAESVAAVKCGVSF